ncbi:hypothetical protein DERP_009559 [Dermatophagoides pteronyssinus]|uniref:Uncharacterized protein n=1 Tax=Dermatophagoides pteronyssinus TaxID=6956 RepID=A0ABQ8JAT6_DERPT|nr:hypothetical protein DERP_009559 [Dermatophagoides pteronyssinus]
MITGLGGSDLFCPSTIIAGDCLTTTTGPNLVIKRSRSASLVFDNNLDLSKSSPPFSQSSFEPGKLKLIFSNSTSLTLDLEPKLLVNFLGIEPILLKKELPTFADDVEPSPDSIKLRSIHTR